MKKLLIYASLVLIPLVLMGSCTRESPVATSQYKTFTVTRGIAHFSFEYDQTYFKEDTTSINIQNDYVAAGVDGPNSGSFNYTKFNIEVWLQKDIVEDANSLLAGDLKNRRLDREFNLLEQNIVVINGIPATQLVFSERNTVANFLGMTDQRYYMTHRRIYFDYNGQVWRFSLKGDSTIADFDKAELNHILETFKFLP
jgi:hypothetical protein